MKLSVTQGDTATPPIDAPVELLSDVRPLIGERRSDQTSGGEHVHVYAATGLPTVKVPIAGAREMDEAVRAARAAAVRWRTLAANRRRKLLLRVGELLLADSDRLTGLQTLESAMPHQFARAMPAAAADFLAYYAGWTDKLGGEVLDTWPMRALDYTLNEPYGVVAVIVPWNAPLVSLTQIAAAALAAGNTVVVKPPELAPFSSLRVGELFLEAGVPPGVLNVVPGGPDGGAALVTHPGVDKIHFTGSGVTARRILASAREHLTPVGLELGGKSAQLIFADSNLRAAARQALAGLVIHSGQGCANGTRIIVEDTVYDEILELACSRLRRLSVGDPLAPSTVMGPVISEQACERIMSTIERARAEGHGKLVAGGQRLDGELSDGYFVAPTIFGDVDNDSPLAQEEIFGPVLSFMRFSSEDEAVRLANHTCYGLAAYIHTSDVQRAHRVAQRLEVGNVWINGFFGVPPSMPFGGTKQSGQGRVGGRAGLGEFLRSKNVWLAL
jgi:aldehyde dehydrogenase (NAD+)